MDSVGYEACFHEALHKAFAAASPDVRAAYFELASFYHRKLGDRTGMNPPVELLQSFVERERALKAA